MRGALGKKLKSRSCDSSSLEKVGRNACRMKVGKRVARRAGCRRSRLPPQDCDSGLRLRLQSAPRLTCNSRAGSILKWPGIGRTFGTGELPWQTLLRNRRAVAPAPAPETRVTAEQKTLIEYAAALQGRTVTDFVLTSVQDAARRTIEQHQQLEFSVRDSRAFVDARRTQNPSMRACARRCDVIAKSPAHNRCPLRRAGCQAVNPPLQFHLRRITAGACHRAAPCADPLGFNPPYGSYNLWFDDGPASAALSYLLPAVTRLRSNSVDERDESKAPVKALSLVSWRSDVRRFV